MIELYRGVCLRTASKRGNVGDNLSIRTSTSGNVVSRRRKTYEIHFNIFDSNSLFFSAFEIKIPYSFISASRSNQLRINVATFAIIHLFISALLIRLNIPYSFILASRPNQLRVNVATLTIIYLFGHRLRATSFREEERRTKFIPISSIRIRNEKSLFIHRNQTNCE